MGDKVEVSIKVRPCVPGDASALALVGQATFLESYATELPGADIVAHCAAEHAPARYAGWLANPAVHLWIAEHAQTGAPVGYAVVSIPDLPAPFGPPDLELKRIYLLSRFHGGGIGARLMAAAVETARASGAPRLLLGVYRSNTTAIAFYTRQEFTVAGERKFQVGVNAYDDLVLARTL